MSRARLGANADRFKQFPKPLLWVRLPLQGALIAWEWQTSAR